MVANGMGRTREKAMMMTFSVYNLTRNNVFDESKARTEPGYAPRSYEQTIADEVSGYTKTHLLKILILWRKIVRSAI